LATKKDFISDEVNNMHVDEISEMIRAKIEIVGGPVPSWEIKITTYEYCCIINFACLSY
jgi:hypothetical protein